ncbi:MAG: PIN domain nuclease [Actinomycetales bacterium]|nr:PIN domain nuclease [Actinomycetales bacterium]
MPASVVEVLRFCIVVLFAGVGFQLADALSDQQDMAGVIDASAMGIILGAAIGYVLGGVIARLTGRTLARAEQSLSDRSAEQVLAGLIGAVLGVLLAAGLTWPLLLIGQPVVTLPLFFFVCITVGTLGHRLGLARREHLLTLLAPRTGLRRPQPPVASLPRLLDTSVAIDGRIIAVVRAGFLHGPLLVPEPVLAELQGLADAGDDLRRAKGRHGLDTLDVLRREPAVDVEVVPDGAVEVPEVDAKLVRMCLDRGTALLTLDTNLAKVAALAGCHVMNLHALTLALRPPVGAGDSVGVHLTRPGKEHGQAVGYLDDGTMVVVERARDRIGSDVQVTVTSVLTTANGRMVFAKPGAASRPGSAGRAGADERQEPAERPGGLPAPR